MRFFINGLMWKIPNYNQLSLYYQLISNPVYRLQQSWNHQDSPFFLNFFQVPDGIPFVMGKCQLAKIILLLEIEYHFDINLHQLFNTA